MDFGAVLEDLADFLAERGHLWAVVGGVALAAYGLARTTLDLDIVLDLSAQEDLLGFLESRGYTTLHYSAGYSNHRNPDPRWGRIDCVYVKEETSRVLFAGCRLSQGPRGIEIPLPRPEHLAAMKVLAIKNDPGRIYQDMADLRYLVALPGVDRFEVRRYFERHGLGERFDELEKTLG